MRDRISEADLAVQGDSKRLPMGSFDIIGIGVGPANLSLAALLHPHRAKALFLTDQLSFKWHEGFEVPQSRVQMSYLKDLVTPVDPTSLFSFLNYLRAK